MWTQLMEYMIEQDPILSAQRTTDAKWYIVNRWNKTHDTPMDAQAVQIFLCDERQGELTEEQRAFAKARKEEICASYRRMVTQVLKYQEMQRLRMVSGIEDFCMVLSPQPALPSTA